MKTCNAFDVELALGVLEQYASQLDISEDSCRCCERTKFKNFVEAKAHKIFTESIRKMRMAKGDVERPRRQKRSSGNTRPQRNNQSTSSRQ